MKKLCRCLFDMVTVLVKLSWGPGPIDDKLRRCITFEMISGLIKIEFLNFKTCLSHCSTSIIRKFSFYDNQYLRLRFQAIMVNRSVCSFLLPFCSLYEIVVLSWIPWIIHTHTHSRSHTDMRTRTLAHTHTRAHKHAHTFLRTIEKFLYVRCGNYPIISSEAYM